MFAIGGDEDEEEGVEEEEEEVSEEEEEKSAQMIDTSVKGNSSGAPDASNLDLLDDVVKQYPSLGRDDIAIAKAACEPLIEEEGSNTYEVAFESSTQESSEKEDQPSLTKRVPLRHRQKSASCYHRLPYKGRMQVLEQYECYYKVEIAMPQSQLRREEGNDSLDDADN